jgi:hypothetical protein
MPLKMFTSPALKVINCFRPKLFHQPLRAMDFSSLTDFYIYYALKYAMWLPAFSDTNEGVLACMKDPVEGATSVTAFKCDSYLVRWLQDCRGAGQILDLDIRVVHINILWLPWDIIKGKEGLQC